MAKFVMLGKYSLEGLKGMAAERTNQVTSVIEKAGGKVNLMYALLGKYDLIFVVDFPGIKEAIKASVAITKLTGISFTSFAAITIEEFDQAVS